MIADTTKPLSAAEASAYLGGSIAADKLVELAQRGQISHMKLPVDGGYLFYAGDLADYCHRHYRPIVGSIQNGVTAQQVNARTKRRAV